MPRLPGFFFSVKIRWFEGVFVRTLATAGHSECITKSWQRMLCLKCSTCPLLFGWRGDCLLFLLSLYHCLWHSLFHDGDHLIVDHLIDHYFDQFIQVILYHFYVCACFFICLRILKARVQQKVECYEVLWINIALGETCPSSFVTMETRQVGTGGFSH